MFEPATASVAVIAVCTNDSTVLFFSVPDLWPKRPSTPVTIAGTNAIPCNSFERKLISFSLLIAFICDCSIRIIHVHQRRLPRILWRRRPVVLTQQVLLDARQP